MRQGKLFGVKIASPIHPEQEELSFESRAAELQGSSQGHR